MFDLREYTKRRYKPVRFTRLDNHKSTLNCNSDLRLLHIIS